MGVAGRVRHPFQKGWNRMAGASPLNPKFVEKTIEIGGKERKFHFYRCSSDAFSQSEQIRSTITDALMIVAAFVDQAGSLSADGAAARYAQMRIGIAKALEIVISPSNLSVIASLVMDSLRADPFNFPDGDEIKITKPLFTQMEWGTVMEFFEGWWERNESGFDPLVRMFQGRKRRLENQKDREALTELALAQREKS